MTKNVSGWLTLSTALLAGFFVSAAHAQLAPTEQAVFTGDQIPDPDLPWWLAHDFYGAGLDIDGDTAVVGAKKEGLGAAYVYVWDGENWIFQDKLVPDTGDFINFGRSVGISGDTIIVGDIDGSDYQGTGSAFIYVRNGTTWSLQQRLDGFTPNMLNPYKDGFGLYVDVDGDTAVISAWHDDDMEIPGFTANTGAVHIFTRNGSVWTREGKVYANDVEPNQHFGRGIVIEGDTLLVSSLSDRNEEGLIVGSAYVFVRKDGVWVQRDKLEPSDGDGGDQFGLDMSINGDTFLISAVGDRTNGVSAGAAYIFERDGCNINEVTKFTPSDPNTNHNFGGDVYLSGDIAVISAAGDNENGSQSGAAYVYKRENGSWTEAGKVIPGDASTNYRFASAVSIHEDTVVAGALLDSYGKAYMFDLGEGNTHAAPSTRVCFDGCHPE